MIWEPGISLLELTGGNWPPVVVSLRFFSPLLSFLASPLLYIFPFDTWWVAFPKCDFQGGHSLCACFSTAEAVDRWWGSLLWPASIFLGLQEIRAGIDHCYLSNMWLSGMPPVFSPDFSGLRYKIEGSEQAVQPFLFSYLHLDPTVSPK